MATYFGIDCAKWQGIINWAKVRAAGVQVAILKATDKNNGSEPAFARRASRSVAIGMSMPVPLRRRRTKHARCWP